jgi:hypothetical protein
MVKEKQDKYLDALSLARAEYRKRGFFSIVDVSGSKKVSNTEFVIPYCGNLFKVNYPQGEINQVIGDNTDFQVIESEIQITDQILILQYLGEVSGVVSRGGWISFLELPGGPHHYPPFKIEAIEPLMQRFSSDPDSFDKVCRQMQGVKWEMAEQAFIIPIFPRLKLAFLMWYGNEEFAPRANILFEDTACLHLNTAGLYMLGINAAEKLIKLAE